jgi:tetratricopeptide (TPR) repeat protein
MASALAQKRLALAVLLGVLGVALGGLGWFAWRSPHSRFLPPHGDVSWIHYPVPPEAFVPTVRYELRCTFRRTFTLPGVPDAAHLQVRAFQDCSVFLNGRAVALPGATHHDEPRTCEVAAWLQAGTNEVRVVVVNDVGPPVLWLLLEVPGWSLASDNRWSAVLDGAAECPAHPAGEPVPIRPGNPAAGGVRTLESFRHRLPTLLLFAALSGALWLVAWLGGGQPATLRPFGYSLSPQGAGVCVTTLAWVLLFAQNTFRAPAFAFACGFDAPSHVQYIRYIWERGALPLADEGWEMHQPPLFYLLAAGLLRVLGLGPEDAGAVTVYRLLGLAAGLAELVLVAACLRLLFPDRPRPQLVGLALAAFLPAHIYTCHYVTNEWLVMVLGTATLYLCLRALRDDPPRVSRHALLGLCLGAALLAKVTALVVAGCVLLVLTGRLVVRGERRPGVWLRSVGVTLLAAAAVSGWHYGRVWAHFGTPLVGNYDRASGFWWWQPPGFGTVAYLGRFGSALEDPFYSAFHSLPDGLYSTFWGDGMCGGTSAWEHRPLWNYDLMAAGFLLALLPSLAIAVGLLAALVQLVRRPQAEWFLLCGVVGALAVGLLYQDLRYPYYGHARASYLLIGLVPVCALGARGLDLLARQGRVPAALLGVLLGTWAMTAYTSFWVDAGAAATQNWAGQLHELQKQYPQAERSYRQAVAADPSLVSARIYLARVLILLREYPPAQRLIEEAWRDAPNDPNALLALAFVRQVRGRAAEALPLLRRAVEVAPDHLTAYRMLGEALLEANQDAEAIAAYRQALRVWPASAVNHANLGLLLARTGQAEEAITQYRWALSVRPTQAEWQADLAWVLATQQGARPGNAQEALRLATEACQATDSRDPLALASLGAAQAANGSYHEAAATAGQAARAAKASRQTALAKRLEEQAHAYEGKRLPDTRAVLRARPYAIRDFYD